MRAPDWLTTSERYELDDAWERAGQVSRGGSESVKRGIFRKLAKRLQSRSFSDQDIDRYLTEKDEAAALVRMSVLALRSSWP
jgi:hypothetical protein